MVKRRSRKATFGYLWKNQSESSRHSIPTDDRNAGDAHSDYVGTQLERWWLVFSLPTTGGRRPVWNRSSFLKDGWLHLEYRFSHDPRNSRLRLKTCSIRLNRYRGIQTQMGDLSSIGFWLRFWTHEVWFVLTLFDCWKMIQVGWMVEFACTITTVCRRPSPIAPWQLSVEDYPLGVLLGNPVVNPKLRWVSVPLVNENGFWIWLVDP